MAALMNRLSWPEGPSINYKKVDNEQCPSSGPECNTPEFWAAHERVLHLRRAAVKRQRDLVYQQCVGAEAEKASLQKSIDQWQSIITNDIDAHLVALLIANGRGQSVDFDAKFWLKHSALLPLLPEAMRPAIAGAEDHKVTSSSTSVRRRKPCPGAQEAT